MLINLPEKGKRQFCPFQTPQQTFYQKQLPHKLFFCLICKVFLFKYLTCLGFICSFSTNFLRRPSLTALIIFILKENFKKIKKMLKVLIFFSFQGHEISKVMFGNCLFPLFSVSENYFLFLRLKNCYQNSICEGN